MCAAITNQTTGQLRLSMQSESPLAEFAGKTYKAQIREGVGEFEPIPVKEEED